MIKKQNNYLVYWFVLRNNGKNYVNRIKKEMCIGYRKTN